MLSWTYLRRNELYNAYREVDPDIILINAHGRSDIQRIKLYGYQAYQKNLSQGEHDGAAIAIRNNITYIIIDEVEESYLACIISTDTYDIMHRNWIPTPKKISDTGRKPTKDLKKEHTRTFYR